MSSEQEQLNIYWMSVLMLTLLNILTIIYIMYPRICLHIANKRISFRVLFLLCLHADLENKEMDFTSKEMGLKGKKINFISNGINL